MTSDSHWSNWDLLIWNILNRNPDGNFYPFYSHQSAMTGNQIEINTELECNHYGWPTGLLIDSIEFLIMVAIQCYSAENSIEDGQQNNIIENTENDSSYCSACRKSFASQQGFKQHVGKKHSNRKRAHKCSICSKKFYTKYILKTHIQNVHINK
ncbi:unnamed protein product [Blepharisma stoltei]|uniref:C2H2-type domain-containing protein n=1 Tax=Blepharisma stoltei TaxID=1481888 RepID=A0AAU9JUS3_9CILI|nr:unnamed protein product [Blepharisma stoltei]